MDDQLELTRRRLLELGLALPVPFVLAACGGGSDEAARATTQTATTGEGTTTLAPTPACDDGDDATPEQTEGPFFTPDSPERTSFLESGIEGTRLVLAGSVLATDCTPVAGALLDFWHADAQGEYDNEGYRLRGHQFADGRGRYRLETIVPGVYTGRTRHIHVKVQAPDRPVLTTQLYFPGEPGNDSDSIFDPSLLVELRRGKIAAARFDFVLEVT
jgi:protocatechuate 3,4-dioxygenase beta subunit